MPPNRRRSQRPLWVRLYLRARRDLRVAFALSFALGAVLAVVAHALQAASRAETHSLLPPPPPDTAYEEWLEEQGIRSVMVDPDVGRYWKEQLLFEGVM